MAEPLSYLAFISYSHADARWAAWLHQRLETYRPPAGLLPGRVLDPVFRDREELGASSDLTDSIITALDASANLIVICSPRAARSRWVDAEAAHFVHSGRAGRIFCLVVDGDPGHPEAVFPPALLTQPGHEPLGAVIARDGKRGALLRLISGLLDIPLAELTQREQQRRYRRLTYVATAAVAGMALTTGLAVSAYLARDEAEAQRQRAEAEAHKAVEQSAQAERAREEAQGLATFMLDLFRVSDPQNARGNDITAREILRRGAERVRTELVDQPATQARLMNTIGLTFLHLGLSEEAATQYEQALTLQRELHGDTSTEVSAAMSNLANAYQLSRRYRDAGAMYQGALQRTERLAPDNDMSLAIDLNNLGLHHVFMGEFAAARPLFERSLAIREATMAADSPAVAIVHLNMAGLHAELGEPSAALEFADRALDSFRDNDALLGTLHALIISTRPLLELGQIDEAERRSEQALELALSAFGDAHTVTTGAWSARAAVLEAQGRSREAETLLRRTLDARLQLYGQDHPYTGDTLMQYARLLAAAGRRAEAVELAAQAQSAFEASVGPASPRTVEVVDYITRLAPAR